MAPITKRETKSEKNSRYGDKIATKCEATIAPEEVAGTVNKLRKTFDSEKTLSREWRMGQLRAFGRMLKECEKEFCDAMLKDLHKSPFEGKVIELDIIQGELDNAIDNLDKWMKPTKKPNSPLNIPCWR